MGEVNLFYAKILHYIFRKKKITNSTRDDKIHLKRFSDIFNMKYKYNAIWDSFCVLYRRSNIFYQS